MLSNDFIAELEKIVGKEDVLTSKEELTAYSYDGTTSWVHLPDAVVFPTSTQEVSDIMKLANKHLVYVTPRGAGTNVSGGSIPIKGGIVLCTTKMNKILNIDKENQIAEVEPGVVLMDLNITLAKEGLRFPPDPQSFLGATLGGNIAENAGGPACVKYGVVKQYILGLEVVLPTGEIVNFGGRTMKNVQTYDLASLIVGSEGTLGIVTKGILRLIPAPAAAQTLCVVFDDMGKAATSVYKILSQGVIPSKLEFVDNWVINRIEEMMPMGLPTDADALLLIESDGIPEVVEKEIKQIIDVCNETGAKEVRVAKDAEEALKYWKARSAGFAAVFGKAPTVLAEDVTVPRNKLPEFLKRIKEISERENVPITNIGHAGDGNLHPSALTDEKDKEHFERAKKAIDEIIEMAVEFGGVLSGEHGIGLEKKKFLKKAVDPKVIELMKGIKRVFDPNNILNPGKIWED
ncbi:MAG: glycolate oxidase subunit GlcD [Spirochaetes bacterium]|nr:FAD-binding protein [Deltaproteobacteria bacterium]RKY00464.1 MAG: glycolate oxidase subunit GlcD [Spirochaetota bacterium]